MGHLRIIRVLVIDVKSKNYPAFTYFARATPNICLSLQRNLHRDMTIAHFRENELCQLYWMNNEPLLRRYSCLFSFSASPSQKPHYSLLLVSFLFCTIISRFFFALYAIARPRTVGASPKTQIRRYPVFLFYTLFGAVYIEMYFSVSIAMALSSRLRAAVAHLWRGSLAADRRRLNNGEPLEKLQTWPFTALLYLH